MPLVTNIHSKILATETVVGDDEQTVSSIDDRDPIQLPSGTGSGQADLKWSDTRQLAASGSEELDLNALTDSLGRTINMAKVKAIHVSALSTNTNNVVVGAAAATQFVGGFGAATHTWAVPPGGSILVTAPAAGWASTSGSLDKLKLANSGAGTAVDFDIEIIGTSA